MNASMATTAAPVRHGAAMTYDQYFDKVYGGWFGKCLGGAGGARCEGIKQKLDVTMRQVLDKDIPNDDLDIQLLWLTVLEEKGLRSAVMEAVIAAGNTSAAMSKGEKA